MRLLLLPGYQGHASFLHVHTDLLLLAAFLFHAQLLARLTFDALFARLGPRTVHFERMRCPRYRHTTPKRLSAIPLKRMALRLELQPLLVPTKPILPTAALHKLC